MLTEQHTSAEPCSRNDETRSRRSAEASNIIHPNIWQTDRLLSVCRRKLHPGTCGEGAGKLTLSPQVSRFSQTRWRLWGDDKTGRRWGNRKKKQKHCVLCSTEILSDQLQWRKRKRDGRRETPPTSRETWWRSGPEQKRWSSSGSTQNHSKKNKKCTELRRSARSEREDRRLLITKKRTTETKLDTRESMNLSDLFLMIELRVQRSVSCWAQTPNLGPNVPVTTRLKPPRVPTRRRKNLNHNSEEKTAKPEFSHCSDLHLMWSSVERLWTGNILPAIDNSLNCLSLEKQVYSDKTDELMASLNTDKNCFYGLNTWGHRTATK